MIIRYCQECAADLTRKTASEYVCTNGHFFWNDPRATAAIVMMKDGQILVSKRGREPFKGAYDLPGGFLEFGEDPLDAAIREIMEETGMEIARDDLSVIAAYTGDYTENESVTDIIIVARRWKGEPVPQDDAEALEWRPLAFLASDEFNPDYPGLIEQLERILGA